MDLLELNRLSKSQMWCKVYEEVEYGNIKRLLEKKNTIETFKRDNFNSKFLYKSSPSRTQHVIPKRFY